MSKTKKSVKVRTMQIEKMSKYISVTPGIAQPNAFGRQVLLSLPRVKWLERQPDYEPWPELATPPRDERVKDYIASRYTFRPQTRRNELSPMQKQAWELQQTGMTHAQIAKRLSKSKNAIGKLLAQAREKLGIGLDAK